VHLLFKVLEMKLSLDHHQKRCTWQTRYG